MILVTGASEGMGWECARLLLERTGSRVLITGRSQEKLDRARGSLPLAMQGRLETLVADQADPAAVASLIALISVQDEILEGAILAVGVNPAYTDGWSRLHAVKPETIEATVRTNCTHTALIAAAVLQRLFGRRSGVLLFIGSRAVEVGLPGAAIYSATKSFLSGLVRATAREYVHRGVRVHLLNPGLVRTPRTADVADRFGGKGGTAVVEAPEVAGRIVDVFLAGEGSPTEADL